MADPTTTPARRTKRRFAHEMYPHPKEGEIRPLSVEVPYLYARALGFGASEMDLGKIDNDVERARFLVLVQARFTALFADAVHQGLTGDPAWRWACEHMDESGELAWDRAVHYGVNADWIKPYPCGPDPTWHYCQLPENRKGTRVEVAGRESECERCTEEVARG